MSDYRAYVYNISWQAKAEDLKAHFGATLKNEIIDAKILLDDKGRSRGAAHVSFSSAEAVEQLIQEYHKTFYLGRELQIVHAKEKKVVAQPPRAVPYALVQPQPLPVYRKVVYSQAPVYAQQQPLPPTPLPPVYAQPTQSAYSQPTPTVYAQPSQPTYAAPMYASQAPPVYAPYRPAAPVYQPQLEEEQQFVRVEYLVPRSALRLPPRQRVLNPETGAFNIEF
jgi:RNA recognition motif-containing protein